MAILAGMAAALFGRSPAVSRVDDAAIRQMVRSTDLDTILRVWQAFEQLGPQRAPPDVERRLQATATVSRLLWIVTAAGALLAAGGGASLLAGRAMARRVS